MSPAFAGFEPLPDSEHICARPIWTRGISRKAIAIFVTAYVLLMLTNRLTYRAEDSPTLGLEVQVTTEPRSPKNAYATFIAKPFNESANDDDDVYFVGTRMLIYQILYAAETRTREAYPFIVLATADVRQSKLDRLSRDGATVIVKDRLDSSWIKTRNENWKAVLTKLRLWELTEWDIITYLDSDTILTRPLDGIFDDDAVALAANLGNSSFAPVDEGGQPPFYTFASNAGAGSFRHGYPQLRKGNNLNVGIMVLRPNLMVYEYYKLFLDLKDRFKAKYPEQDLLSYVHRRGGNMPWTQLHYSWNTNWCNMADVRNGIATLHAKFWNSDHDPELRDHLLMIKWRMEGYWKLRDQVDALKS